MVQLLSNVSALDLGNFVTDGSRVSLGVLTINCIHDFDINLNRLIKEATWLDNHVALEQVPELLDRSLNINIPLGASLILEDQFFQTLLL